MPERVRLLWNPASGRGRGARMIDRIRRAFAAHGMTDVRATESAGDESRLVHEALDDGIETIVVAGGDGTWSKCATTLARAGSPARMAFVAAGTGNDFAKNLRAPARDPERMAQMVAEHGVERRVDLGRVDDAWFTNVAGFGFDVAVLQATGQIPLVRGPAVYVAAALRELFGFAALNARVTGIQERGPDIAREGVPPDASLGASPASPGAPPDAPPQTRRRLMMVFANGREFGGVFKIAPSARVDDGKLDALVFNDASRVGRIPLLLRALVGAHASHPRVSHTAGPQFTLEFSQPPHFELDGELHKATSERVTVACVPAALRVLDAPAAR